MVNVSSAMGAQFAAYTKEITETIQQLGPNPLSTNGKQDYKELEQEIEKAGG